VSESSSFRPRVIAVEEAYATESWIGELAALSPPPGEQPEQDFMNLVAANSEMRRALVDFDLRLRVMDASGVDVHLLSFTAPGMQMHGKSRGTELAAQYNDELFEIINRRPDRFAGLGSVAPQDPERAAREIERIMGPLGLSGVVINSHTYGRYLDEPEFEPILAAAEASGATIYLHPRVPSPAMLAPYNEYGMLAALWGFAAEAGTHALRLIMSGAFDRFPRLRIVLGHLGEALPYWVYRVDNMAKKTWAIGGQRLGMRKLDLTPSEYLKRNFGITSSGMEDSDVLMFCFSKLGEENVMFAIDYPYEDTAHAMEFLKTAPLTRHQLARFSHKNAERFFRIPAAAAAPRSLSR
jgi:predicted TIM-barrel fold metal-dependent hydrolase